MDVEGMLDAINEAVGDRQVDGDLDIKICMSVGTAWEIATANPPARPFLPMIPPGILLLFGYPVQMVNGIPDGEFVISSVTSAYVRASRIYEEALKVVTRLCSVTDIT